MANYSTNTLPFMFCINYLKTKLNMENEYKNTDSHALYTVSPAVWIDNKGRQVEIHTMSDRWLNNIRKKFKGTEKVEPILAEIKRRKLNKKMLDIKKKVMIKLKKLDKFIN